MTTRRKAFTPLHHTSKDRTDKKEKKKSIKRCSFVGKNGTYGLSLVPLGKFRRGRGRSRSMGPVLLLTARWAERFFFGFFGFMLVDETTAQEYLAVL